MWQPVLMISGYFISVLGLAMLFPAALDIYDTHSSWSPFLSSAMISLFLGMSMFLANKTRIDKVSLQQGYLLTVVSWFSVTLIAAIPFMMYGTVDNWADAIFEASSGISTTGATIITNLDESPRAILLWRSILNGLGGIGIVIFAIAMLPFLGIGGNYNAGRVGGIGFYLQSHTGRFFGFRKRAEKDGRSDFQSVQAI